jgi:uncharacterized membrane protein YbhN (UPF0104 family)
VRRRIEVGITLVGCAVGAVMLARLVAKLDGHAAWTVVGAAGPAVAVGLVPFVLGMAADAYGLVVLLRALGHTTTLARVLPIRLASEALHATIPGGFVASDTATAVLLESRCGVPVRDGIVASLARKWLVMRSHSAYIAVGAVAGFAALGTISRSIVRGPNLPWIVLASALVPLVLATALRAGLLGRSTFTRLYGVLARIPWQRLARWLESRRHEAVASDAQSARLRASRGATALAGLAFLVCWCFESLESALLLRLAGVDLGLASIFAIEAGLSLVRSAIVVTPSGLGVVDMGYATVLSVLGADVGGVSAFLVLKRGKEVVWVLAGYTLLAAFHARLPSGARTARLAA